MLDWDKLWVQISPGLTSELLTYFQPVSSSETWGTVTLTLRGEGILCELQHEVLGCFGCPWLWVGLKAGPRAGGRGEVQVSQM